MCPEVLKYIQQYSTNILKLKNIVNEVLELIDIFDDIKDVIEYL